MLECLPDHLFSLDGQPSQQTTGAAAGVVGTVTDTKHDTGTGGGQPGFGRADEMMASFKADAEGQWAAVAVANAGLGDEYDDELLAYKGESLHGVALLVSIPFHIPGLNIMASSYPACSSRGAAVVAFGCDSPVYGPLLLR